MHKRVRKALHSLVMDRSYRFFATLLLKLKIVEDPTCKTFWVDGISLGYNPAYLDKIDDDEIKGVLAHEALHPALGHIFRMAGRDQEVANHAADYAINPYVRASGLKLPKGSLNDPMYNGSLEENYAKLMREREQQQPKQAAPQQQPSGGSQGQSPGQQQPQPGQQQDPGQGQQQGQQPGPGQSQPAPGQGAGQPGSEASATAGESQKAVDFDPGCGEVRAYPGEHPEKAEAQWKITVLQAVKAAQMVGQAPGWLQAAVLDIADPSVEWRALLMRFVQDVAPTDYTWARPNRRYLHLGMYLPSLNEPVLQDAVFVRDSSGSLWSETQAQFDAEIVNVFETMQPKRLVVLDCDVKVTQMQVFERGDAIDLKPVCGGGGTSFVAPFNKVGEEAVNPAFLVYLTDMEGTFPGEDPGYPVLWASTTKLNRARKAPFGETIEVIV
jgi:predicted metal-dependent peptidase